MELEETEESKRKTGTLYMTDNDNLFIADKNLSQADFNRLSLETDIQSFKEKLAKMEAELSSLVNGEKFEEIERNAPLNRDSSKQSEEVKSPPPIPEDIPPFSIMTKSGMKQYEKMKVTFFDEERQQYFLDNGKEKVIIPASTFETITHPETLNFKQAEKPQEIDKAEERPAIVEGQTKLPEFAVITSHGMKTFKDLVVQKHNKADNSYVLSNGNTTLTVSKETLEEISKPERFETHYDENTPQYEKLIQSQYDDYFKQRDNTANNFRHNLSVYCRKEANTPLDALTIAKELVSRMDKEEKAKTQMLLKQMAREDETINQLIVRTYYEAIKEVPLKQEKILQNQEEKLIAKPFYDTINTQGQLVDKDSNLKIGDTIKDLAFNVGKTFGHGKEKVYEDLTVISASKEGNNVILMDKNRSFYEVPRDTLLEGYNKQQEKQHKAEMKQHRSNRIDVGWER